MTAGGNLKSLVVLVSHHSPNRQQVANQERASTILKAHGIDTEEVDAVSEKELRNRLFEISGTRGNYPQFFIKEAAADDKYTFLGLFDDIEQLNETGNLTKESLGLGGDADEAAEEADWIPLDNKSRDIGSSPWAQQDNSQQTVCFGCILPSWFPKISNSLVTAADSSTTT